MSTRPIADCLIRHLTWRTFYPLVDTELLQPQPRPKTAKFSTIGQWYWGGGVEVNGEFPDLSKKFAFEPYLDLPRRVPEARFELAMNLNADDPEIARLRERGWHVVSPHRVARTPGVVSALCGEGDWANSRQSKALTWPGARDG